MIEAKIIETAPNPRTINSSLLSIFMLDKWLFFNIFINIIIGQPSPANNLFAPVTFAETYPTLSVKTKLFNLYDWPAVYANTVSIAYSGRTAINAIIAITKDPEISFSLDSAAHEIINAAEKIENPYAIGNKMSGNRLC